MAKNYNNDKDGGILRKSMQAQTDAPDGYFDKLTNLSKRPKYLVWSFIAIAAIMLISFLIPEKYYHRNINILLLNVELIILFVRNIVLYFKKSRKMIRAIMLLMVGIYVINVVDLLFNIPHTDYLTLAIILIVAALSVIYMVGYKK